MFSTHRTYYLQRWHVWNDLAWDDDHNDPDAVDRYQYTLHTSVRDVMLRWEMVYVYNSPYHVDPPNDRDRLSVVLDSSEEMVQNFVVESAMNLCWSCPIENAL